MKDHIEKERLKNHEDMILKESQEKEEDRNKIIMGICRKAGCSSKKVDTSHFDYCEECYTARKCISCNDLTSDELSKRCYECWLGKSEWGRKLGAQLLRNGEL
jgi:hypothetical protein